MICCFAPITTQIISLANQKRKVKEKSKKDQCGIFYDFKMQMKMGLANENRSMDEISVVLRRFGDEQSTLLDQFERLSFEVQLSQAILGRSLSESSGVKSSCYSQFLAPPPPPPAVPQQQVREGRTGFGFNKVLKRLLKPILCRKGNAGKKPVVNPENPMSWKAFSRSIRF